MNNSFATFVQTYWDDIVAFFRSLVEFFQALVGSLASGDEEETTAEA